MFLLKLNSEELELTFLLFFLQCIHERIDSRNLSSGQMLSGVKL